MDHQSQLEKSKYRNWVRGGLVYKYLKEGIERFADEVVIKEHNRILKAIKHTPGLTCNQCILGNLKPLHKSETDPNTNRNVCRWGQTNCNCLFPKKRPCPNKVCDAILEEILKSHGSQPPTPNLKNTDIQKWCSTPWEVAKCFINAVGYSDKTTAADIDAPGLLHVFINNINLHTSIACKITGTDVFNRVRQRRNEIFHSPTMELEDKEMNDLIDDVIEILEDENELKRKHDAKQAVEKLRHLKRDDFIITTHNEVEVCETAMGSIAMKSEELQQVIEETKSYIDSKESQVKRVADNATADIDRKEKQVLRVIDDKTEQAKKELEKQNDSQLEEMKQTTELLKGRVGKLELDNTVIKQRLTEVDNNVKRLHEARIVHQRQLEYVEQKQACQKKLVKLYQTHYVKTWISPLKVSENEISIDEVYVTPRMTVEEKGQKSKTEGDMKSETATQRPDELNEKLINRYSKIFHTDDLTHKKIYILGDVGSGKSSFCKMLIYNWCRAVTESIEDDTTSIHTNSKATTSFDEANDIHELRRFSFLFFIPLQRLSGLNSGLAEMIKMHYKDDVSSELLETILGEESEHCLVLADGLDEWSPQKEAILPLHVSHGIPLGIKNATIVTLSRPSAKGILNMKSTECDKKIKLHGLDTNLVNAFITKYLSKQTGNKKSVDDFWKKIKEKNLEHLEKSPLFLQQLIWMYSNENEIGKTVSDVYSNIVNSMFGWSENKDNLEGITEDTSQMPEKYQQMQLPRLLNRFPRCRANKIFLFSMGNIAFNAFTTETTSGTFGLSSLLESGLTKPDIYVLKSYGILVEYNYSDPTYEKTYFSFFAALYISSQNMNSTVLKQLFEKYKSAGEMLQLTNLLKLVCGLSPSLLGDISRLISINVTHDKNIIEYRSTLHNKYCLSWKPSEAAQIQQLICNCLCESGTDHTHAVSLCDIIINSKFDMSFLRKIIPYSVLSLHFDQGDTSRNAEIFKWVVQLHRLQFIHANSTAESYLQLASSRQKDVTLKHLDYNDLSKHTQLHSIHLENCAYQVGSLGNSEYLESVYISYSFVNDLKVQHEWLGQLLSSLTKVVSLKHLTLKHMKCSYAGCNRHITDLSEHTQLHSIHSEDCAYQVRSLGNSKYLENVYISYGVLYDFKVQHEMLGQLLSSLTKVVSLKHLTLKHMKCSYAGCNRHIIDLSEHTQLHSIRLEDCAYQVRSLGNSKYLENVYTSYGALYDFKVQHEWLGQLLSSLTKVVSLKHLTLTNMKCSSQDCIRHIIDLSEYIQLHSIHLTWCPFQIGCLGNTENLETVHITSHLLSRPGIGGNFFTGMNPKHDKLALTLSQAVSLKDLELWSVTCHCGNDETQIVDLSKHVQLQRLALVNIPRCLSFVNIGTVEKLEVNLSNMLYVSQSLRHISKLKHLNIAYIPGVEKSYTLPMNTVVQTLHQLQTLAFFMFNIDENALTVSPGMQNLETITLNGGRMSLETWQNFLDSLLTLKQSVQVHTSLLRREHDKTAAQEYVSRNPNMFEVLDERRMFIFKTKPK